MKPTARCATCGEGIREDEDAPTGWVHVWNGYHADHMGRAAIAPKPEPQEPIGSVIRDGIAWSLILLALKIGTPNVVAAIVRTVERVKR